MNKTIVLEGPDDSGKSTLARALQEHIGCRIITIDDRPKTLRDAIYYCEEFVNRRQSGDIMDRATPISELIYRSIFGEPLLSPADLVMVLNVCKNDMVFIHCRPAVPNIPMPKHDYDTIEYVEQLRKSSLVIREAYAFLFAKMAHEGFTVIEYDYQNMSLEQLFQEIKNVTTLPSSVQ
jgi:energy-coupling factor transporter ATP-binding protein EcfA2